METERRQPKEIYALFRETESAAGLRTMSTYELVKDRFQKLVDEGGQILKAARWDGREYYQFPSSGDYLRFRTEAMNLVRRSCGEDSDHYRELKRLAEATDSANNSYYLAHCVGVVEAARSDFEAGLLFDLRSLITAEVLGDFIDQAQALISADYHVPAASLAGAVLEDTLRKLCDRHKIVLPARTKIDSLNAELARANVYDKLIQKRITAIADIRNNADHGRFDRFKKEDVEDMVKWIRGFAADYLK
ncbi:MAG TPA: hypothetical protein VEJ46_15265 [Candidatus Acidoferrum sp.]|jgi:hypothetical protein|nr:hypothetical protein [Candidatus Acidoferrum sp.]